MPIRSYVLASTSSRGIGNDCVENVVAQVMQMPLRASTLRKRCRVDAQGDPRCAGGDWRFAGLPHDRPLLAPRSLPLGIVGAPSFLHLCQHVWLEGRRRRRSPGAVVVLLEWCLDSSLLAISAATPPGERRARLSLFIG